MCSMPWDCLAWLAGTSTSTLEDADGPWEGVSHTCDAEACLYLSSVSVVASSIKLLDIRLSKRSPKDSRASDLRTSA